MFCLISSADILSYSGYAQTKEAVEKNLCTRHLSRNIVASKRAVSRVLALAGVFLIGTLWYWLVEGLVVGGRRLHDGDH